MRKLASIQKIKTLQPIEGADAIETATVLGWQLVVKKGEFNVGDLVVYCEIDCLMPDTDFFLFLKPRGMRIRTIRLRGQISQGICFPTSILPGDFLIEEDADITDVLGITKYEPPLPACLSGMAEGLFPSFIPKTDETRVQVLQGALDIYKGAKCYVAEKLDGSSTTYFVKDGVFRVCSRNLELKETEENSFWKVARIFDLENKLLALNKNIALQGELIGEGIQNNKYKLKGQTVAFFNAFDIDAYEHFGYENLEMLLKSLSLPMVPVLSSDYALENDIASLVKLATIKSTLNKDTWAEGIVIRPILAKDEVTYTRNLSGGRVSFKAINPEFLLKYGD
jgi:RNA ligase (TIGR02306 family)